MTLLSIALGAVLLLGGIGIVLELPKILSHHINQPVQRRRRERALRRKLAWYVVAVWLLAGGLYAVLAR